MLQVRFMVPLISQLRVDLKDQLYLKTQETIKISEASVWRTPNIT